MTRVYALARSVLERYRDDDTTHFLPPDVMLALEEIHTIGQHSLEVAHADRRLAGEVPYSTVFVPREPQPQPHPHPQPHPQPQTQPQYQAEPQLEPQADPQPQTQAEPQPEPDPRTPVHPIEDFYRPFTPGGTVYRISPVRDYSIPPFSLADTDLPSSSSFPPAHIDISPPPSQFESLT